MIGYRRIRTALAACVLAAVVGLIAGCTYFDYFLPGTPFTPDQPVAKVTLEGQMQLDPNPGGSDCPAGGTLIWGNVRNTGDVVVVDVSITVDAFAASGAFLGSFTTSVYSGKVTTSEDTTLPPQASTSLEVDQTGSFEVCTPISFGTVARTDYRTEFVVIDIKQF